MKSEKLIIITLPDFFEGEADIINKLFANGIQHLHLRKPEATKEQLASWIEKIETDFRSRIVLHDHHDLAFEYGLGGIHLNSRNPKLLREGWGGSISRSCHSIAEVEACQGDYDYVFLSPIFDSISKQGYRAAFSKEELADAKARGILSRNVYALGGVTFDNLKEVEQLGFYGAALLGGFWETYSNSPA